MKKILILCSVLSSNIALADMTDFLIKFSQVTVEEILTGMNQPPTPFDGYCELIAEINKVEKELDAESEEPQMSEAECNQHIQDNQKKCTAKLSSEKVLKTKEELEALTTDYVDCVLDFEED